jgi:ribosomal protein L16 Arg81 hydroxylase
LDFSDNWYQWIAENRLRDCSPESMVETMVAGGLDRDECTAEIAAMEKDPVFIAARRHQQLLRKLESVVANQQKLWESAPGYTQVEKRRDIPAAEFAEKYVRGSRPVVLQGLADDWPALRRWSPQDLKERFGRHEVEIQVGRDNDPNYEVNKLSLRQTMRLADFVDKVMTGGPTNDYYMTANNELLRSPEFAPLLADIGTLPDFCDRSQLVLLSSFWFGPAGTVTPLHHDTVMLFHTQIVGRKRWRFVSPLDTPRVYNFNGVFSPVDVDNPDLGRYPLWAQVKMLEVVVEPGETVFLPLGWWHQVTSLDISLSFSFTNIALSLPNAFTYQNPSIHDW